jgi:hypothetical protein
MTPWDDPWDVDDERGEWTDLDVERLLRGASGDDVPRGLEDTAVLLVAARGRATADETDDRLGVATALASSTAVLPASTGAPWWRAPRWIAIAAIAAVLVTSGVAAAATHGLSSGTSGPSSNDSTSIDVTKTPEGDSAPATSAPATTDAPATTVPDTSPASTTTVEPGDGNGVGPLVAGPALRGLCTAFAPRTDQPGSSVAYRNLAEAAAAAHQLIQELCAAVLPPGAPQGGGNAAVAPPGHHDGGPPGRARGHGNGQGQNGGD